jgi:hypothetical protein
MQERFVVLYVVEWGDTARQRFYPGLPLADDYARLITTDGTTAFPHYADILRQTRRHDLDVWEVDQSFVPIKVKRGQHYSEPDDLRREDNLG